MTLILNLKLHDHIIGKYEIYISNLQYHLDNNNPSDAEKARIRERINDFKEVVGDLKLLVNKKVNP